MNYQMEKNKSQEISVRGIESLKSVTNQINVTNRILKTFRDEKTPIFSVFVDPFDGKKYNTVRINDKVWMADNLKHRVPSGIWVYDNEAENCVKNGKLYNSGLVIPYCPKGWYLPTDPDWDKLMNYIGGYESENAYATSFQYWKIINFSSWITDGRYFHQKQLVYNNLFDFFVNIYQSRYEINQNK